MEIHGSVIHVGTVLKTWDWIVSPSRVYFAIIQADGNFVVYRGSGPQENYGAFWDTQTNRGEGKYMATLGADGSFRLQEGEDSTGKIIWNTPADAAGKPYFAHIQDDGNFVVYEGTLGNVKRAVWATYRVDLAKTFRPLSITYDLTKAKVAHEEELLDSAVVDNSSGGCPELRLQGKKNVSERSLWSCGVGLTLNNEARLTVATPLFVRGALVVSPETKQFFAWNESRNRSSEREYNAVVTAPKGTKVEGQVLIRKASVELPATLRGEVTYQSGAKATINVAVTYQGTNAHQLLLRTLPIAGTAAQDASEVVLDNAA